MPRISKQTAGLKDEMRELGRTAMKVGMEMGYDKCVQLVERISEAWGESEALPAELKKFRTKVLADMQDTLDSVVR